jgi:hypothetical protein
LSNIKKLEISNLLKRYENRQSLFAAIFFPEQRQDELENSYDIKFSWHCIFFCQPVKKSIPPAQIFCTLAFALFY